MYVEIEDFSSLIDTKSFQVSMQDKEENLNASITQAIEEASGYLRSRHDVELVFATTGIARNAKLVQVVADITLFNLISWLPAKLASEIRVIRYESAIKWLKDVQKGVITLDLPPAGTSTGDQEDHQAIQFGSMQKNTNDW